MKIENEEIRLEEVPDKKEFLVHRSFVERMSPEELVANYTNVEKHMAQAQERLDNMDNEVKQVKKQLANEVEIHKPRLDGLGQGLKKAKIWAEEKKQKEARKAKGSDKE